MPDQGNANPGPSPAGTWVAIGLLRLLVVLVAPSITGCAGMYFQDAGEPPSPPPRYTLDTLPFDEYWAGLVFNGAKIGFSHLEITPGSRSAGADLTSGDPTGADPTKKFVIRAEAAMRFRLLGLDKRVTLKAIDEVHPDLTIKRFSYNYELDDSRLRIDGEADSRTDQGHLTVDILSGDAKTRQTFEVQGPIYPTGVIGLYPVYHGLEVGRVYRYQVYDGETQSLAMVEQDVLAFERSDLFEGRAFKIRTRLHGHEVTTWINLRGEPVLETSLGGVLIAGLESESMAKRHLTLAALNKDEALIDFSRVSTDRSIAQPRRVDRLAVRLRGFGTFPVPTGGFQRCAPAGDEVVCDIGWPADAARKGGGNGGRATLDRAARYLESTLPVPSRDRRIRDLAHEIATAAGASGPEGSIEAFVTWIQENVEQAPVDVFSALDVLRTRRAECQGNTFLYSALARARGIPTRVVNGLVYSEIGGGFLYHTWAESFVDGRWLPVDPTFGQARADATHVKLIEGEKLSDLAPMTGLMGRISARIDAFESRGQIP